MTRKALSWVAVAIGVALSITAVNYLAPVAALMGPKVLDTLVATSGPPARIDSADLSGSGPGSVVTATTMPGVTGTFQGRRFRAARVVYRSTNGDTGEQTVVSGSVFTPKQDAPSGGWPVVALGHGSLGIEPECGPSLSPDLFGLVPSVQVLTALGYAVALPDYQGLGVKGIHPYLDSRTAGLNMIDAVRALHRVFTGISDKWVPFGHSQGAGAAWAANEQAASYAPELKIVGALVVSPPADVTGIVDKAQAGTLTPEQRGAMQGLVESLARLHPDLNRDDFRQGAALTYWNVLTACSGPAAYQRGAATSQLGPRDFVPRTREAADQLRALLRRWALPQKPLSAPMFVWYGADDPYIDAQWTTDAIEEACALGGEITIDFDTSGGHNPVGALMFVGWLGDRFAGKPAPNDC